MGFVWVKKKKQSSWSTGLSALGGAVTTRDTKNPASKQSEILIFFFKEPGQNDPGHHASKICTFNMTLQPIEKVIFF